MISETVFIKIDDTPELTKVGIMNVFNPFQSSLKPLGKTVPQITPDN
jgi:hypothetical protein